MAKDLTDTWQSIENMVLQAGQCLQHAMMTDDEAVRQRLMKQARIRLQNMQQFTKKAINLSLESEVTYAKAIGVQTPATQAADRAAQKTAPAAPSPQPAQQAQPPQAQTAAVQSVQPLQQAVYLASAPAMLMQRAIPVQVVQAAQLQVQLQQAAQQAAMQRVYAQATVAAHTARIQAAQQQAAAAAPAQGSAQGQQPPARQ